MIVEARVRATAVAHRTAAVQWFEARLAELAASGILSDLPAKIAAASVSATGTPDISDGIPAGDMSVQS